MPLVNMTTNLKSLRFGKDTVGGGNSAQPFVVSKIPDDLSDVGRTGGPDFLLRGGTLLPKIILNDTKRISKLFYPGRGGKINTTNPDDPLGVDESNNGRRPVNLIGTLFTAKQNILSLSNVNSGAGYKPFEEAEDGSAVGDFLRNNLALNQGIYTPLSTIGQTVGNALGIHLNKQGLNPLTETTIGSPDGNTPLGLPTYLNTIATPGSFEGNKSRLNALYNKKVETNTQGDLNLYSYSGGPGATLGVGKTNINMISEYRTGENNSKKTYWDIETEAIPQFVDISKLNLFGSGFKSKSQDGALKFDGRISKTPLLDLYYGEFIDSIFEIADLSRDYLDVRTGQRYDSVYQAGTKLKSNLAKFKSGVNDSISRQVWKQEQIYEKEPFSKTNKADDIKDFRKVVAPSGSSMIPNTLPYTNKNKFEQRVSLGNPGKKANRRSYTIGRQDLGENRTVEGNSGYKHALDKVNALPIYQSGAVTSDPVKNDFVKFRIGIIDNDNPSKKTFIHFRAIIDTMSDDYSADWADISYMGRGEKFFKYSGFDRTISLGWTVAAQSKQELIPMYQKLNYLASSLAPNYSDVGYMRGNLASLTIGGWCYEQPGIITGLSLSVPEESPWEISIPDAGNIGESADGAGLLTDPSVKEVPMIVKVSGFNFKPIHNFIPQLQDNSYVGQSIKGGGRFVSKYGQERFIALANEGGVNNYSGGTSGGNKHLNYIPSTTNNKS